MTSVWKRLQRVGKNASKFQFTASYQSLTVECSRKAKWQPDKLSVIWTRRRRRKVTKPQSWQPGIGNPFRGVIVWPEGEEVDITVTLYKDPRSECHFEDKEWTFIIEDVANGRHKPIAMGAINMAEYASMEFRTFNVSLKLKISSKKIESATLELELSCILLKEGKATDADMQSISSMMSLNDIDCLEGFNEDEFEKCLESGGKLFAGKNRTDSGSDSSSFTESPSVKNKKKHKRSKSGEAQKYIFTGERSRRLSTGSDISMDKDSDKEASKHTSAAETELLEWCKACTEGYPGVTIKNMTTSWRDGLAFCALLHHFEPTLIDFKSLDRRNIKDNNQMVFEEFDKLGIPRLLDPATLALKSKPDKLSVMTYLFQIKTYFTTPKAPSLFNLRSNIGHLPAIREVRARVEQLSPTQPDAYNPFLGDDDDNDEESPISPLRTSTPESKSKSDDSHNENNKNDQILTDKMNSKHVEDINTQHSKNDTKKSSTVINRVTENCSTVSVKEGYNPFEDEEEEGEDVEIANESNTEKQSNKKPAEGYNPFDDDNDDSEEVKPITNFEKEKNSKSANGKTAYGYNPFEDDIEDSEGETTSSSRKRDSYLAYNPFDDDEEEEEEEEQELQTHSECVLDDVKVNLKETDSNPFSEANDSKQDVSNEVLSSKAPPKPPRVGVYTVDDCETPSKDSNIERNSAEGSKVKRTVSDVETKKSYEDLHEENQKQNKTEDLDLNLSDNVDEQRRFNDKDDAQNKMSNSTKYKTNDQEGKSGSKEINPDVSKPEVTNDKEVRGLSEDDSPWVVRRPDSLRGSLRRQRPKSGASSSPSRSRPTSLNRPSPLVPTYEESKAAEPGAGKDSPQASAEKEDIKVVARRILMEARKKAGASDLLPRERVEGVAAERLENDSTTERNTSPSKEIYRTKGDTNSSVNEEPEKIKQNRNQTVVNETLGKSTTSKPSPKKRQAPTPPTRTPPPPPADSAVTKKAIVGNRPTNRKLLEAKPRTGQKKRQAPAPPSRTPPLPPTSGNAPSQEPLRHNPKPDAKTNSPNQTAKSSIQANRKFEHRPLKVKLTKDNEKAQPLQLSPKEKYQNERNELLTNKTTREYNDSEKLHRFKELLKESQPNSVSSQSVTLQQYPSHDDSLDSRKRDTTPSPSVSPRKKKLGHAAAAQAYAETRKMDFKNIRPVRHRRDTERSDLEDSKDSSENVSQSSPAIVNDKTLDDPTKESIEATQGEEISETTEKDGKEGFQDTTEYVKQEILNLEEEQRALDKVASKLEKELRGAMKHKGCEEEEERLLQEWFILVNKKNALVQRQTDLSMLEKVDELERKHEMINRELRTLMAKEEWEKTEEDRQQEMKLFDELIGVVNMRDQLVQVEDSQQQQLEKDEKHVQRFLDTRHLAKDDKNEQCCIQ